VDVSCGRRKKRDGINRRRIIREENRWGKGNERGYGDEKRIVGSFDSDHD